MNLSMKWLNEFVDIDVSPKDFADAMTMSGSKVESFEEEGSKIKKVVVGKVLKIEKHPDADRLVVCQMDVAQQEPIQIVTGAKNLNVGDLVPVALDGSTLTNGTKIKKGKLRGVLSQGMMCSLAELGLHINDFPYAIEDGIFVLQEDCKVGQDIKSAIGLNDTKVEFEITSNRPDCFSMIGLAREAAATFDKELKVHTPKIKNEIGNVNDMLSVETKDSELCPFYSAKIVRNVKIGPSPRWMRERLRAMGVRPINNIVDITNYVMLEYGQPMHAFDMNLIDGNKICARRAQNGEKIKVIDGSELSLKNDDLVIADSVKPIALAGVMGGKFSGVSNETKTVIFESANFKGSSVRKSAKRHGFRTESSSRYEKGLDVENCIPALNRACELVELIGAGEIVGGIAIDNKSKKFERAIDLDYNFINSFLSLSLEKEQINKILEKINCKIVDGKVIIPSFRQDLKCGADIAEEIARFYGYNKIKSVSLKSDVQGGYSKKQLFRKKVTETLIALGLNQIITYSLTDPKNYEKIFMKEANSVKIRNPIGETSSIMRTTAIPSMLEVLSQNYNKKNKNVKLFEIAREYVKTSEDSLPEENEKIVVGMYGDDCDFFVLKGIFEELTDSLHLGKYDIKAETNIPYYHPGRCAVISCGNKVLGTLGEIHPRVCENFDLNSRVYVMSLDVNLLFDSVYDEKKYKKLPKYPSVERDLCLICDSDMPVQNLINVISESLGNLLENVSLFDVYSGEQIDNGKKSVTFSITLRSHDSTLEDEQISSVMKKVIRSLENIGAELRK